MKRWHLLDFLRGLAISCVVADHAFSWLAPTHPAKKWFIFSVVPLFFLSGITYALSFDHHPWKKSAPGSPFSSYWRFVAKKSTSIVIGYTLALLITRFLSGTSGLPFFQEWLIFPYQFYYVLIYLEIMLVAPFLARSFERAFRQPTLGGIGGRLIIVAAISLIANRYPVWPPPTYLPGRLLFGGVELLIFAVGIIAFHCHRYWPYWCQKKPLLAAFNQPQGWLIAGILASVGTTTVYPHWELFAHPPTVTTICYCLSVACLAIAWYRCPHHYSGAIIGDAIAILGRFSLFIFLGHCFFANYLAGRHQAWLPNQPLTEQILTWWLTGTTSSLLIGLAYQALSISYHRATVPSVHTDRRNCPKI